jgi:nanoRNase/pAp phosphatase (c-di-AMP/oligoRNAs hydrolase)
MTRPLVLYHATCADGAGAAWAAWMALGDGAEYRPVQHGHPALTDEEVAGRDVTMLDFAYSRAETERLHAAAKSLVIIDHHRTAAEELAGLPYAHFDLTASGAVLAWRHFMPPAAMPTILSYIEDRDLWRWKMPLSKEVSAALEAMGILRDFRVLTDASRPGALTKLQQTGGTILKYRQGLVEAMCATAREVELDGHLVLAANAPVLQSEVAGALSEGRPFGVAWFRESRGLFVISLRRHREGTVDVSEIAKQHGGGGHAQAAGFQQPTCPWP